MSASDIEYSNGWLYNSTIWPRTITPLVSSSNAHSVGYSYLSGVSYHSTIGAYGVWPSVYLSSDIQIIGGDGNEIPYKLSIAE
jgi:hypothetical protein